MTTRSALSRTLRVRVTVAAAAMAAMTCLGTGSPAHAGDPALPHARSHSDSAAAAKAPTSGDAPAQDLAALEKQWGIKLLGLRQTAAGYMLDLRFLVRDAEKAAPLLARDIARHVIVDKSGAVLRVPSTEKLGSLRSTVRTASMVKSNRIYNALFANPGRHVKAGDRVTLVLGEFRAERLTVE